MSYRLRFVRRVVGEDARPELAPPRAGCRWTTQLAALLAMAAFSGWMLSLPCFPSSDGPVHLYYVQVLGALLGHSPGNYALFFRIRHLLPPYALYYYALLALGKAMPLATADRVVICVYFVSFVLGFRFLAQAIGPAGDTMTLLATALLLNWPLGMGFVNFCLSLSFALWAAGLWVRILGRPGIWSRVGFLVLVVAITLTHPVPLLLLLAVCGALLLARVAETSRGGGASRLPAHGKADLWTLGLAALSLGYVKLFTLANPLAQTADVQPVSYWSGVAHNLANYAREHALTFVLGTGTAVEVYRAGLLMIVAVALGLAGWQRSRNRLNRLWTAGDTFLVLGLALAVALPFIPSKLNGLYYFADRLVICIWLGLLLAASGSEMPWPRWSGWALVCVAVVVDMALLVAANGTVRPAAEATAALGRLTLRPREQVGFILEDSRPPIGGARDGVSWNPYYWASIGVFRRNDALLANAPWTGETILPVAPTAALPELTIPALQEPLPTRVQADLLRSPGDLRAALRATTFFVVDAYDRPRLVGTEPLLRAAGEMAGEWHCRAAAWYRICTRSMDGVTSR